MKRRIMHGLVAIGVALATTLISAAPAQAGERSYEVWFGHSGKCLELGFGGYVRQWSCNGQTVQKWYFDYMGEDLRHVPIWRIRNAANGWCLANDIGHTNDGALSYASCAPVRDESDKWQLLPVEGSTYYRLRNRQNYLCATLFGGDAGRANGAYIYQWDCNLGNIQYVGIS